MRAYLFVGLLGVIALAVPMARSADRLTTDLVNAAQSGDTERTAALIAAGAKVNGKGKSGLTPLLAAVAKGHANTARVLLDKGAFIDARGQRNETPLFTAALNGSDEVVSVLL